MGNRYSIKLISNNVFLLLLHRRNTSKVMLNITGSSNIIVLITEKL
jgi:hypothetical protein